MSDNLHLTKLLTILRDPLPQRFTFLGAKVNPTAFTTVQVAQQMRMYCVWWGCFVFVLSRVHDNRWCLYAKCPTKIDWLAKKFAIQQICTYSSLLPLLFILPFFLFPVSPLLRIFPLFRMSTTFSPMTMAPVLTPLRTPLSAFVSDLRT